MAQIVVDKRVVRARWACAVGAMLAAVLVLSGCVAPTPQPSPAPTPTAAGLPEWQSSLDLVGLWTVSDVEGVEQETWLEVNEGWLTIWDACTALSGSWVGDGTRFRSQVSTGFGPCIEQTFATESWITSVREYAIVDGGDVNLLDDDAAVVAVLTPTDTPPIFDFEENGPRGPVIPVAMPGDPGEAESLAERVTPVTETTLNDRWTVVGYEGSGDPHAIFGPGSYTATDGCNGAGGPLLINADGRFSAGAAGGSTQVGCDNIDLPAWIVSTARAGIDDATGELVLQDWDGRELVRLIRTD